MRSSSDRLLAQGAGKLSTLLAGLPEAGRYCLFLAGEERTGRLGRQAVLTVRWAKIELLLDGQIQPLHVVEAREVGAPAGQKPLYWRLLTTHAVAQYEQARQIIEWYQLRWNIEQVFRLLKQKGLQVELLDLESGKGLVQLTLLALLAASKILLLHLASKQVEPVAVRQTFTPAERECLLAVNQKYEGKTKKQLNPYPKDSLQWCYWVIARVGGWKPHEKQAGVITICRGWSSFQKIYHGWLLAKNYVS